LQIGITPLQSKSSNSSFVISGVSKSRMWHNVPVEVEELAADLESEKTGDS
jgi:hypothetical protein